MEDKIMQWIILGIVVAFIAIEKARKLFNKPKAKGNPNNHTKIIGRLVALEVEVKNIKEDIKEIKRKLNGLKGG